MSISYPDHVSLTCPQCQAPFTAPVYVIVDGVERPDLVARILDETLHDVACPQCGQVGRVPAPLLYHDSSHARVLYGVPPDMPEAEWSQLGQNLLWVLIGALPEEARLSYLGEVQAEAGLAGVAHVIANERLAGSIAQEMDDIPPIVIAIQALLAAQGPAELQRALDAHPILDEPQSVVIMQELAAEAFKQGEEAAAEGFGRAAKLLDQVKQLRAQAIGTMPMPDDDMQLTPEAVEELVFALLRSTTGEALARTVDQHPILLEEATDQALATYVANARREGKQRIADGIDERREALHAMQAQYRAQQPILDAIQIYLQAETNDEIEAVVLEHEVLTTDAADQALERLASSARTDGDGDFALFVDERRMFLQQVRAALNE